MVLRGIYARKRMVFGERALGGVVVVEGMCMNEYGKGSVFSPSFVWRAANCGG